MSGLARLDFKTIVCLITGTTFVSRLSSPSRMSAQVKTAIGAALIEENLALFEEAGAYSEILGDVHLDTEALLLRRKLCSTPLRTMVGVGSEGRETV